MAAELRLDTFGKTIAIELNNLEAVENQLVNPRADIRTRLDLVGLEQSIGQRHMGNLVKPLISSEEPLLFLILDRNGTVLFHETYQSDIAVNASLMGNVLSAIHLFGKEVFGENLVPDIYRFDQITTLVSSDDYLVYAYVFRKGGLERLRRLNYLIRSIQSNLSIYGSLVSSIGKPLEQDELEKIRFFVDSFFRWSIIP